MTLVLEHTWEQALIGATVEAAKRACPNCYLGRTAIQKLLYFLNVLGVPMQYSFELYHYGPYCAGIPSDVEWLIADDVIQDEASSEGRRYSKYKPGPNWQALKTEFQEQLAQHAGTIDDVVLAMGPLDPEDLELIATLDFSFRWIRAGGGGGPWKPATIEKFKAIKKDKFQDQAIEHWHGVLVKAGLIEP